MGGVRFKAVLKMFARSAMIVSALEELTVKQVSRDSRVVHPDDISSPLKLSF